MAGPQHRTPEYRAAYRRYKRARASGTWFTCVQPICMKTTRDITPTEPADVAHDDSGTAILGLAHEECNSADGGRRRHQGTAKPNPWVM